MEKLFRLKQNGTTVRTEIIAGLTTFMTMAYIIALNPNLLTGFGADGGQALWNGVFLATCIASAIGTFCYGLSGQQALRHGSRHGPEQLLRRGGGQYRQPSPA